MENNEAKAKAPPKGFEWARVKLVVFLMGEGLAHVEGMLEQF